MAAAVTAADTLALWGVLRADDVVAIARSVGLDVARAATLLELESGGRVGSVWHCGLNVWGHDGVSTGGAYQKGGEVTQASYAAYRSALAAGTAGRQGVGPCQLTAADYQDQADRLGGCWRWEINAKVGFDLLNRLISRFGERDGYVAYNGGPGAVLNRATRRNPAAEQYGDKAVAALARWRDRLGPIAQSTGRATQPAPPISEELDVSVQCIEVLPSPDVQEIVLRVPVGSRSAITDRAWISAIARVGDGARVRWFFQGPSRGITDRIWTPIPVVDGLSAEVWDQLPDGTTKIVVQADMPYGGSLTLETVGKPIAR